MSSTKNTRNEQHPSAQNGDLQEWCPPQDEKDLLCLLIHCVGAQQIARSVDEAVFTDEYTRHIFSACCTIWNDTPAHGPLTLDSLATYCQLQADEYGQSDEARQWATASVIVQTDLTDPPRGIRDPDREAGNIARRLAKIPRFKFKTLPQLEDEDDPEFLINWLLIRGGLSLLTGKHGSYKSFFALAMALCVAYGLPFHGYEVIQGVVIYIAAEGASGIKKRAKAWRIERGVEASEKFIVVDVPVQIHDDAVRTGFITAIASLNPSLIVFDTLARCAVGLDENNAGDMGRFADALGALARATGAHILTVHHNAKGGEYRGSTAIPAAVDTHITFTKGEGPSAAVKVEMPKQKDFEAIEPMTFEPREVSFTHKDKPLSSLVFVKSDEAMGQGSEMSNTEKKVFEALKDTATEKGVTSSVWKTTSEGRGVSASAHYLAVKRLLEPTEKRGLGLVTVVHGEHSKRGALYAPTLQNALNGALEQNGSKAHSVTPTLHSPVGSGVLWSNGVSEAKPQIQNGYPGN